MPLVVSIYLILTNLFGLKKWRKNLTYCKCHYVTAVTVKNIDVLKFYIHETLVHKTLAFLPLQFPSHQVKHSDLLCCANPASVGWAHPYVHSDLFLRVYLVKTLSNPSVRVRPENILERRSN